MFKERVKKSELYLDRKNSDERKRELMFYSLDSLNMNNKCNTPCAECVYNIIDSPCRGAINKSKIDFLLLKYTDEEIIHYRQKKLDYFIRMSYPYYNKFINSINSTNIDKNKLLESVLKGNYCTVCSRCPFATRTNNNTHCNEINRYIMTLILLKETNNFTRIHREV